MVFRLHQIAWDIRAFPEVRVQVSPQRFRIPDITIMRRADPDERIVRVPPLLCIEVLSSEDTLTEMARRAEDYRAMDVAHIWAADPWKRKAYRYAERRWQEPTEGTLTVPGTPIRVLLSEVSPSWIHRNELG